MVFPDLGGNGGVMTMRVQVILHSPFVCQGSAPLKGGKKGEFRDWAKCDIDDLISIVAARLTQ